VAIGLKMTLMLISGVPRFVETKRGEVQSRMVFAGGGASAGVAGSLAAFHIK
jgi:hypothetical protein